MRKVLKLISALVAMVLMLTMVSASALISEDTESSSTSSYLFDDEIWELINSVSGDSAVEYNVETGEVSVVDSSNFNQNITETPSSFSGNTTSPSDIVGGSDKRKQITNVNDYPYCPIVYIKSTYAGGVTTYATGVFVDDTTIITAGHAIYYRQNDTVLGYATSVTVYPGGTSSSFGSSTAVQLATTASWISSGDKGGDYGVITISSSMGTGYYGMSALSDTQLNGKSVYCTGYPGDKDDSTLWRGTGKVGFCTTYRLYHSADTYSGMSGSPVVLTGDVDTIVAIHTTDYSDDYNGSVRITSSIIAFADNYMG